MQPHAHLHSPIPRRQISILLLALMLLLSACAPVQTPAPTASATATLSPTPSLSPTITQTLPVWGQFAGPSSLAVTPIPSPAPSWQLPDGVKTLVLVGLDRPSPYAGRSDSIWLIFYNPQTARASLLALPPDLYVYLPGYTMQRLSSAYAIGKADLLLTTIEYNFGIRPDDYVSVPMDAFAYFIDNLGGIDVDLRDALPDACSGVDAGMRHLDGQLALCVFRQRSGLDETTRAHRQQAILNAIFSRLVTNGNLTLLSDLVQTYSSRVLSSFTLDELAGLIPLALRMGDGDRLSFDVLQDESLLAWRLPDNTDTTVQLPQPQVIDWQINQALAFISTDSPQTAQLATLQYALTISPTPTDTPTITLTPVPTWTRVPTMTFTRTVTATRTSTITATATITLTPTITATPTVTETPTVTQTLTPTATTP